MFNSIYLYIRIVWVGVTIVDELSIEKEVIESDVLSEIENANS